MKGKFILTAILFGVLIVALGMSAKIMIAQGSQGDPKSITGTLGNGFTYQGQLKQNGGPVNATCGFTFSLWDSPTGGTQLGASRIQSLAAANGLFTSNPIDFGAGAFDGNARYLQMVVQCPGDPGSTTLPRQALTPAPYALALPGLYTQQNATSPNVIGGYSGNKADNGVYGATIGGGGVNGGINHVSGNYDTIGGGSLNLASNDSATVGGGYSNTASGWMTTVGGGYSNTVSGNAAIVGGGNSNTANAVNTTVGGGYSNTVSGPGAIIGGGARNTANGGSATVGGGASNTASGTYSTVGGGTFNIANAVNTTVGGGYSNTVSGPGAIIGGGTFNIANGSSATVGGGAHNTASGTDSTVAGGETNVASSDGSAVCGGVSNNASGAHATVPGGIGAFASHYGELAYSSGGFGAAGDAQTSVYVLRNSTTDAAQTELFLDGLGQRISVANNRTFSFEVLVTARSSPGESAGYRIWGVIKNVGGATSILPGVSGQVLGSDDATWNAIVQADTVNNALVVKVNGATGKTIRWVAVVKTAEVAY